jgi:hypothetical protein
MDPKSYTRREIRALWVMAWLLRATYAITLVSVWNYERGLDRLGIMGMFLVGLAVIELYFVRHIKRLKRDT